MSEAGLQIRCVGCHQRCPCYFEHCHMFVCHTPNCKHRTAPPNANDRVLPDGTVMFEDNGCVRAYFVPPELLAGGAILCILDTRRDMCIDVAIQRPGGAMELVLLEPWALRPPRTGPPFDGWNWRRAFVPVHRELHTHELYVDRQSRKGHR
ncbi:hypothetical protein BN1708_014512 [Verticillium longisporum]|uniref:Uncharacterized protein n=1 Tax=Verticillium longisporum TaxID=100787 RepID=A0A0G4LWC5_VERLO|nr:hypothetical protein HYQ44_004153 [Verticillium longisporum]CRK26376.1 hypothetical protein BN1708_014512 [Verticillium longisporum]